jgi:L-ascorbate metabolism protein UlaG (beta-lactamase superfamily)
MEKPNSIHLQYLGCSAFVISDGEGTSVALDLWTKGVFPYAEDTPDELGLGEPPALSALLVSHDHQDHCFIPPGVPVIHGVRSRKVDDSPDLGRVGNFAMGKFSSQHFGSGARRPKQNAVFVLAVAGVKVVHLGDAHGTMADAAQLRELKQKIREVDVLMIPIGSPWLKPVDKAILDMTIGILDPRVSIPMHYWTLPGKAVVLSGLSELGYQLVEVHGNTVHFSEGSLPARNSKTIWNVPAGKFHPVEVG